MGTARYYPPSFGPPSFEPARLRNIAYIGAAVAILSALTVFLSLCARDNSLLLSLSKPEQAARSKPSSPPVPVVTAETQPAADTITRVAVPPPAPVTQPAAVIQPTPSEATAVQPEPAIAKTRTELLSLEKRGTRHYVEFSLARSKRFQQVGPLGIGIWRIDTKHKTYDVSILADGRRIDHKHVSLNSPVSISTSEFVHPLQLVVNSLDREGISGYLSEPQTGR